MKKIIFTMSVFFAIASASSAFSSDAIVTDSRIKTLVYNPNDVYSLLMVYGYQSNIEFSEKEEIQAVSVGDRVGWQIVASGHRLFIRPQEFGSHTNMTVITNVRSYQFDLKSAPSKNLPESEELVYVARFFYPEEEAKVSPKITPMIVQEVQAQAPVAIVKQATPIRNTDQPPLVASTQDPSPVVKDNMLSLNYNYTYTGLSKYAPKKIYDDGRVTYVTFSKELLQKPSSIKFLSLLNTSPLISRFDNKDTFIVTGIQESFLIRYNDGKEVSVFNEAFKKQ